jgi:hypothetical protein
MKSWLALALLLPVLAHGAEPIDVHYTNRQVLAAQDADAGKLGAAWFDRCAAGGQFADLAASMAPDPRMTREQRQAAEGKFDPAAFEKIAQATFDRVVVDLPQGKLTLCVDFAHPADTFARDQMKGVMAMTAGSGRIIVKLHPDADWATLLPYVLAHELHHSYWAGRHFDPEAVFTLADYLVFEGRADNYAVRTFGQHPAPWIDALTPAQYDSSLATFAPLWDDTTPAVLMGSMFGNPQAGIPAWAGYTVGYRLVAQRLAAGGESDWRAITALPTREFMPLADAPAN